MFILFQLHISVKNHTFNVAFSNLHMVDLVFCCLYCAINNTCINLKHATDHCAVLLKDNYSPTVMQSPLPENTLCLDCVVNLCVGLLHHYFYSACGLATWPQMSQKKVSLCLQTAIS